MNLGKLATLGLQVRLALARFGWGNSVACVFCLIGTIGWWWGIPYLNAQSEAQERALKRAHQSLQLAKSVAHVVQRSLVEERLANFYDLLGEKRYAEQQIKTLFAIANKTGLSLNQAEYKSAFDKNGRFYTYQILLPVKGSYSAIRQFCEQTLLAIPFASLDEMSFQRDAIANRTLEAKLRFTLYLTDTPSPDQDKKAAIAQGTKS